MVPGSQTASLFVRGHREGVAYPRHLGCCDVSVLFVVPLWETTPAAERGRRTRHQLAADSSIDSSSPSQSATLTCSRPWKCAWAWSCPPRRAPCSNVTWARWCGRPLERRRCGPRMSPPARRLPSAGLSPTSWCGQRDGCKRDEASSRRQQQQQLRQLQEQSAALGKRRLPEQQVVSGGMRSHGVADVLVDLCPLVQGLHCPALQQVLVPVALLPQHPRQDLLGAGGHLDGRLPQPQREAVMHLRRWVKGTVQRNLTTFFFKSYCISFCLEVGGCRCWQSTDRSTFIVTKHKTVRESRFNPELLRDQPDVTFAMVVERNQLVIKGGWENKWSQAFHSFSPAKFYIFFMALH